MQGDCRKAKRFFDAIVNQLMTYHVAIYGNLVYAIMNQNAIA